MKILLGIGGSEDSFDALTETVERAAITDDDLTIALLDNPDVDRSKDDLEELAQKTVAAHNVTASIRRLSGDPGPALVELAGDEDFDRIVLGGGQRSPMGKINVGSIAEFVILNAQTSVTLIR